MEVAGSLSSPSQVWSFFRGLRIHLTGWNALAVFFILLVSTPLLVVFAGVFQPASEVWDHVASTLLNTYVTNSLVLILGTGLITFVAGVTTAWCVTVYKFPGQRIFDWALILPLSIPTYIVAYTYAGMLDYTGFLQSSLRHLFGPETILNLDIMTMPGLIFVVSAVLYPYVYVIARASFLHQSFSVFEAARSLGYSHVRTFLKVALPLARPAIVAGLLLVVMETLNDYGAAKYFGIATFTTGIFRSWFSLGDAGAAIRLSAFLMAFVLLLIGAERLQRGRDRFQNPASGFRPIPKKEIRGWKMAAALLICMLPLAFGFVIPTLQLILWCAQTAKQAVDTAFIKMLGNSFLLATTAAFLTVALAVLLVYAARLRRSLVLRGLSKFAVLGYAIPGAVIAIGVMLPVAWLDLNIDHFLMQNFQISSGLLLSGTVVALMFAYIVRFLALAVNPVESGFEKSCAQLDDAARSLGASPIKALFTVNVPLIKGALLGAVVMVFVDVLKELPLTLILRPFNFDTLATRAFELASEEMVAESAASALIIIAAGLLPVFIINKLLVKRKLWES